MSDRRGGGRQRLLCLVQLPPPIHGTTVVNDIVVRSSVLAERFDVDVLPLQFAESVEDISRPSLRKAARALTTAVRLGARLARVRPDAVYFTPAIDGPAFYRDLLYVGLMKAFAVPRVYHVHGKGIADQLSSGWKRALYAWVFADARVIQLSPRLATDTAGIVPAEHVEFVPNGLPDRGQAGARVEHDGPPRILFLSALVEAKGPFVLLDALAQLRARGCAFEATFAGTAQPAALAQFRDRVAERGLASHVSHVGPRYDRDKHALFREHDIFVFPTLHEAFGLVLLEAMQHELPIVATDEGAIPDIVVDGETGFVVPPRDAGALAARLERLVESRALRTRLGERGRARYLELFTISRFEERLTASLVRWLAA